MRSFITAKGTQIPFRDLRGQDYLEVKYRLVWFREEHPKWRIETGFVSVDATSAFAWAKIFDEANVLIQTGHKFEDKAGFGDFREKAETGAVGRALAMLGYGTQFAPELDEGERIVDSPVDKRRVVPEQPADGDGHKKDTGYRIPFGKWAKRSLEEVGPQDLASYVNYLEESAKKKNQPIVGQVLDFIERASDYIASFENTAPDGAFNVR